MIRKGIKHIQKGTLLSTLKVKAGFKPSNPDRYYKETANSYLEKRVNSEQWKKEESIVQNLLEEMPNGLSVLDVPFGTGRFVHLYLEKDMIIYGLDISKDMLNVARNNLGEVYDNLCNVRVGSADNLPYGNNSFDLIVCCRFFHHIDYLIAKKVLSEFYRVIKPTSKIAINIRTKKEKKLIDKVLSRKIVNKKKLGGNIYEKDLINIFEDSGLYVKNKLAIDFGTEKKPNTEEHLYVLEKNNV